MKIVKSKAKPNTEIKAVQWMGRYKTNDMHYVVDKLCVQHNYFYDENGEGVLIAQCKGKVYQIIKKDQYCISKPVSDGYKFEVLDKEVFESRYEPCADIYYPKYALKLQEGKAFIF